MLWIINEEIHDYSNSENINKDRVREQFNLKFILNRYEITIIS